MKTLIKLIGALVLTTTPVVTVVACNSENNQMSPRDILNSAGSFINNSNINVIHDLNLPDATDVGTFNGKIFSELDANVKTLISTFFSSKLKESTDQNPTNWYHSDAKVELTDVASGDPDIAKAKFVMPVSAVVNGHMLVTAKISIQNYAPVIIKNIMITIINDTTRSNDTNKATAIASFISDQIDANKLNVNVENLPISGKLTDIDSARDQLTFIQQNLNDAIKDKVQYVGLTLGFRFSGNFSDDAKSILFTMTTPTKDSDNAIVFNGKINNVTIDFFIGNDGYGSFNTDPPTPPTSHPIEINQTFADATTQITKTFIDRAVKPVIVLPTLTQTYNDYNAANPIQDEFIKDGFFKSINQVYNTSILGTAWVDTIITVTNPTTVFNLDPTGLNGYFSLNFNLKYDLRPLVVGSTSQFDITVEKVQIELYKVAP